MFALIVMLLLFWMYSYVLAHPAYATVDAGTVDFQTGDIVLFHALDNVNHMFIFSYYCHVGIVYADKASGKKYLFEAVHPGRHKLPEEYKSGIVVCDLDRRINSYRGYVFYKRLLTPLTDEAVDRFRDFMAYALENMFYYTSIAENFFCKILRNDPLRRGTNCGELVTLSLMSLGVMPPTANNRRHHLKALGDLRRVGRHEFAEAVYLLPDQFCAA